MIGLLALSLICALPARPEAIDAAAILRRAEEVRSPNLDYAVDFTIGVRDDLTPGIERKASYTMIAHGKDRTMVLMIEPAQFYGGTLMIAEGAYWLLLPMASRSYQLSAEQVLRGDIANGDLARADLASEYQARLDGEESIEGEPCYRLELARKSDRARYSRLRCWISKKKSLPRKYEYYGLTGALLRTARYGDYRKTPLGVRPMKLDVENKTEYDRLTTMVFTHLRKIDASALPFTPEGMVAFRDAAAAKQKASGGPARLEDLVAALAAGKS